MLPLVSIVIPFYNCPYIEQSVSSALHQTYPNIEVIVVDDGSTMHQERLAPYHSSIHYIGKANGGTASALNYGFRVASGKYVTWLSSDDRFAPHKVSFQASFMEQIGAQISHTDFDVMNEHGQITVIGEGMKFPTARSFIESFRRVCPVNGCTVMMRRELLPALGWFNEGLKYTHDYELWIRVLLSRVDFHYINQPLTVYRRHSGMGTVRFLPQIQQELALIGQQYGAMLDSLTASLPG
ncbi:glycosyltransferase [Paenibacillus pinihumi]|uniref:glycosyltransferase n=1 Tax=Paenibacillus pinihumi TaxID=669462 RepID=UPI0004919E22|nr:glycosyltransferase [Paenibacillus pinihumi]